MSQIAVEFTGDAKPVLSAIEGVNSAVQRMGSNVTTSLAAVPAIGSLITGTFTQMRATIGQGAELSRLSAVTGQSAGDLLLLQRAMKMTGGDASGLQPLLRGVSRALSGINEDGQPTNASLRKLGLNMEELRGSSIVEVLSQIGRGIAGLPTPFDRTAAAMQILGRSAADQLPLLLALGDSKGLERLRKQTAEMGSFFEANAEYLRGIDRALSALEGKGQQFHAGLIRGLIDGGTEAGKTTEKVESLLKIINAFNTGNIGRHVGERIQPAVDNFLKYSPTAIVLKPVVSYLSQAKPGEALDDQQDEADRQLKGNAAAVLKVASPGEASKLNGELVKQLDEVEEKLRNVGQAYKLWPAADRAEMEAGLRRQASLIQLVREALADLPPAIMAGRLATRQHAAELQDLARRADELRPGLGAGYAKLGEDERKSAREALPPREQMKSLLGDAGAADLGALNEEIAVLEKIRALNEANPASPGLNAEEVLRQEKLLGIRTQIAAVEKTIATHAASAYRTLQEEEKAAPHKNALVNRTPREQQRIILGEAGQPTAAGLTGEIDAIEARRVALARNHLVLGGAEETRQQKLIALRKELLGVEHALATQAKPLAAYNRTFTREMAELSIKLDPSLTGRQRGERLRAIDAEKRRDQYTEQGVAAGLERPEAARTAGLRVSAEDALSRRQRELEEARSPQGISSLQRIGGGQSGGGGSNPLLVENQRQTRAIEGLRSDLNRLLKPPSAPSIPARPVVVFQ